MSLGVLVAYLFSDFATLFAPAVDTSDVPSSHHGHRVTELIVDRMGLEVGPHQYRSPCRLSCIPYRPKMVVNPAILVIREYHSHQKLTVTASRQFA